MHLKLVLQFAIKHKKKTTSVSRLWFGLALQDGCVLAMCRAPSFCFALPNKETFWLSYFGHVLKLWNSWEIILHQVKQTTELK